MSGPGAESCAKIRAGVSATAMAVFAVRPSTRRRFIAISTVGRRATRSRAPRRSGGAAVGTAVEEPVDGAAGPPERLAAFLGGELVHRAAVAGQHHAVRLARGGAGHLAVPHVRGDPLGV